MIVEDDQVVANIHRNKLVIEGYDVQIAADGEIGLESVRRFRPDAVILDLMLPKVSGVEVLRQVRAEPEFKDLPIIVFSNTYLSSMVQAAWREGATKCLSKANCSPKQLLEVLRTAIGNSKGARGVAGATAPGTNESAQPHNPSGREGGRNGDSVVEIQRELLQSLPATASLAGRLLQDVVKTESESVRVSRLERMQWAMHSVTGKAALAGLYRLAQMTDALEALLKALLDKPKSINSSNLRTVASALDLCGSLGKDEALLRGRELPALSILVVDDEAISRRAVTCALEKAKLKAIGVENPQVAYELICENTFDLLFLDIDMPGMTGHELCAKVRALPNYKNTPVVFVTGLADFDPARSR